MPPLLHQAAQPSNYSRLAQAPEAPANSHCALLSAQPVQCKPNPFCCLTGELVVGLFSLVHRLTFTQSCLASIFYVAAAVLVPQGVDVHVGTRVQGAAFIIGPLWFGAILAGIMVSWAGLLAACLSGGAHVTLGSSTLAGLC